jgi:serine/threonine-protein kinase
MAEIYRAKTFDSHGHAHLVAVKRVLAHLAEDDDFIQMLVDEAKIAGLLRHPNIARVYEFARAHGEYFIAMEHVDGKDLRSILERCRQQKRPMLAQHVAYIGSEIATALHAAHTAVDNRGRPLRIVHRDVSPSNVICSYTGEVKLCDFGIAKATLSKVNTKTGVIKGKVKYMSPEQALGRKLDHRSDVFSLGSCLYEMLTRLPPFTASNEMDLLIKVRDAKYRPISERVPGVPAEIEAITDRCLTRSRAHRYQTAAEVAAALREFLHRHMPSYSRSHLGRYVRKKFATEIERELRMLEEFVVETVDGDVGENLIAGVLGPQAPYTEFTPRPTMSGGPAPTGDGEPSQNGTGATTLPRAGSSEPGAEDAGGFDLHAAETVILDSARRGGRRDSEDLDEALHNAPTLILDSRRGWRK